MHTGSRRTTTTAWRHIRRVVLDRDGYQCTITEHGQRCAQQANEVHHIVEWVDGGSDDLSNLVSICKTHHLRITALHANKTRWAKQSEKRAPERHPGLVVSD